MPNWTRRELFRATAAATVAAVPAVALGNTSALARTAVSGGHHAGEHTAGPNLTDEAVSAVGPVMVYIHDATRGEVSIMNGKNEVVVRNHRLVREIMRAAGSFKN